MESERGRKLTQEVNSETANRLVGTRLVKEVEVEPLAE